MSLNPDEFPLEYIVQMPLTKRAPSRRDKAIKGKNKTLGKNRTVYEIIACGLIPTGKNIHENTALKIFDYERGMEISTILHKDVVEQTEDFGHLSIQMVCQTHKEEIEEFLGEPFYIDMSKKTNARSYLRTQTITVLKEQGVCGHHIPCGKIRTMEFVESNKEYTCGDSKKKYRFVRLYFYDFLLQNYVCLTLVPATRKISTIIFIRRIGEKKKEKETKYTLENLIFDEKVLKTVRKEIFSIFDKKEEFKRLGTRLNKGVVLHGKPGNGKTSIVKCITAGIPFVKVQAFSASSLGQMAKFKTDCCSQDQDHIIICDDVDIAMFDRRKGQGATCEFLSVLDGTVESAKCISLVIFTTNEEISNIDPAFKRPGRIDTVIEIPLPNAELRTRFLNSWHEDILAYMTPSQKSAVIEQTENFSFAMMEGVKSFIASQLIYGLDLTDEELQAKIKSVSDIYNSKANKPKMGLGNMGKDSI